MFNATAFYQDHKIQFKTKGHKHCRPGWIQIPCPHCAGNVGYHLGYCIKPNTSFSGRYVCWRCGGKGLFNVVHALLKCSKKEVLEIIKRYGGSVSADVKIEADEKPRPQQVGLPLNCRELGAKHRRYLINERGFDPDALVAEWGLVGTGLDGHVILPGGGAEWYKFRIIIPIYYKGVLISFQGRDITGKSGIKYKACPQALEVRDHKHSLYGLDKVRGNAVVVTEGVMDVWRLGPGAVATFGIKWTAQQLLLLAGFKRIFLLYDPDPQAIKQADQLAYELGCMGRDVEVFEMDGGDPAELAPDDARALMRQFLG
jgi:hypothetical protein